MKRQRLTTRQRVDLFHRHDGRCHLCSLKILAGQEWEVSHPRPLEMGGPDDDTNRAPAHKRCHRQHTSAVDVPTIAKTHRQEARHLGGKAPSRNPIPGGRRTPWKMTFGRGAIRRRDGHG